MVAWRSSSMADKIQRRRLAWPPDFQTRRIPRNSSRSLRNTKRKRRTRKRKRIARNLRNSKSSRTPTRRTSRSKPKKRKKWTERTPLRTRSTKSSRTIKSSRSTKSPRTSRARRKKAKKSKTKTTRRKSTRKRTLRTPRITSYSRKKTPSKAVSEGLGTRAIRKATLSRNWFGESPIWKRFWREGKPSSSRRSVQRWAHERRNAAGKHRSTFARHAEL